MELLITNKSSDDEIKKIERLGYKVKYIKENKEFIYDDIKDVEVLVGYNPFKKLDVSKLKKLKYIQLSSIGIDQLPKESVLKNNIVVCNNKGNYSTPISEYIVMYILNSYKNTKNIYDKQKNKIWNTDMSLEELTDKNVLFIGTGTISNLTAKKLRPFGVNIYGVNTDGRSTEEFDKCYCIDKLDEVIKECDILVLAVPSTDKTVHIINESKLLKMKDKSIIINVGRGNTINESDLIKCIKRFKSVCLDVFENEPLSKESELWEFENVTITSHNSWVSNKNKERTFESIYNNLKRYINNEKLENIVDVNKGY